MNEFELLVKVKKKRASKEEANLLVRRAREVLGNVSVSELSRFLNLSTEFVREHDAERPAPTDPFVRFFTLRLDANRVHFVTMVEKKSWIEKARLAAEYLGAEPTPEVLAKVLGFGEGWISKIKVATTEKKEGSNPSPSQDEQDRHAEHVKAGLLVEGCRQCSPEVEAISSTSQGAVLAFLEGKEGQSIRQIVAGTRLVDSTVRQVINKLQSKGKIIKSDDDEKPARWKLAGTTPAEGTEENPAVTTAVERRASMVWPVTTRPVVSPAVESP